MIGAENVLFFGIRFEPIFGFKWHANKDKHQSCPPPIKYTYESELTFKKYWNTKQWKQKKEQHDKTGYSITCVNNS